MERRGCEEPWRSGSPAKLPAVALLDSSPDFIELDAPMVKMAGTWVREDLRGARDPLVALERFEEALGRERGCGGGCRSHSSPACTRAGRSGARVSAQRGRGACARHEHPETRIERGWGALQGIRHGGAGAGAAASHRRPVFRPRERPT